ncbi:MAG: family 10 glycosylhydrolase [Chitinophagaceae bacterium]|nr:family 10 glycosylhydrolase [Chitinophagaceae bacterium]
MKIVPISWILVSCLISICFAQPKYEFRAAWIATVDHIDWPSRGNYNSDSQKAEFIKILDMHVQNGMNAVVMQIRPAADAFYPSQYEPWSQWLTGKQGKPPAPYYDPLEFMIEEAHKRGLEFHAWCNPYRAEFSIGKSSIAPTHITRVHPEWFLAYGGKRYFDPGNKQAQDFVVKVIRDIVSRYDVDALHFDDYFYPYRIAGKEFPDNKTYAQYGAGMDKNAWRRSNVDSIIVKLNRAIKEEKSYCRFGISPFGVWRNKSQDSLGSNTSAGQTNYDDLYADILLWLREGYIDYVVPQLYWEHGHRAAPYEVLVDWWANNSFGKHCYIGLGYYKGGSNTRWKDKNIIPEQIRDARKYATLQGQVYFSSKSFVSNPNGWNDSLRNSYYKYPALIPPMYWIDSAKPTPPVITSISSSQASGQQEIIINIANSDREIAIRKFALYAFTSADKINTADIPPVLIIPALNDAIEYRLKIADILKLLKADTELFLAFTTVDANNMESDTGDLQKLRRKGANAAWEIVR